MNRMTAAEYQKTVCQPARIADATDHEWIEKLKGNPSPQGKDTIVPKKPRVMEEDLLTEEVANYLDELIIKKKVLCFSHIPQETFTRSWKTKAKNKAMGVRSGVPDMLIVYPDAVLFLELKRAKGGTVSASQKFWIECINTAGDTGGSIYACVAAGFEQAKKQIDSLLT